MKNSIIGAIAGDIIGSIYEWKNIKTIDFPLFDDKCEFTDDSVLTLAVADCILNNKDFALTILEIAQKSAEVTHNHIEGIKGAQAVAASIFLAKNGEGKESIKNYVSQSFGYKLDDTISDIRPTYRFNETCQGSVPQAIIAFLESTNYEHAIRLAISIGGDSDTIACITGGIASAFYKDISKNIIDFVNTKLPSEFKVLIDEFDKKYIKN